MGSYDYGKPVVCQWIRDNFPKDSAVLDVGACDGKWKNLLPEYAKMDAVEACNPYARELGGYRQVFNADIKDLQYGEYDLIIFGDVLEHLTVEDAQKVLEYAWTRCRDFIVAVPFQYEQGIVDGNPYEIHIQDDLTPELMRERYPDLAVLHDPGHDYCYYHTSPKRQLAPGKTRTFYKVEGEPAVMSKIGQRLKLARTAADLSRSGLAQLGFVSIQAVSAWERGDAVPRLDIAARVADVLGVSLDWLAGRDEKPQNAPQARQKGRQ